MIIHQDSHNMNTISDESIHCVITSPPYPMIAKWDSLFMVTDFYKQHEFLKGVWDECNRVLIPGGIMCINIGDATRRIDNNFECYPNYAFITMYLKRIGFTPLIPILWKKISNRPNAFLGSGFLPVNAYISQDCEYIGIYRKGNHLRTFSEKEKINRNLSKFTKKQRDLWFQQIWEIQGKIGAKTTSAFPDEIPYRLINMFSIIGDIVLDPFAGTGTVERVANSLLRNFVGYEKEIIK